MVIHATSSCIRLHIALLIYSISFADKIGGVRAPLFCQCEGHPSMHLLQNPGKKEDRRRTNAPPAPPSQLKSAYPDQPSRHLQDYQRIKRRDHAAAVHIRGSIKRAAACRDLECDHCVRRRDHTIAVNIAADL